MNVIENLRQRKAEIIARWIEAVFATYPLETAGFLRTRKDPFANPAANMTAEAAEVLFNAITDQDVDPDEVKKALDRFMKFRAAQKLAPSQNMAIFYFIKPILREIAKPETLSAKQLKNYLAAESRVDTLVLLAFDLYCADRELIAEERIREIRSQHAQLAKWARKLEGNPPAVDGVSRSGEKEK